MSSRITIINVELSWTKNENNMFARNKNKEKYIGIKNRSNMLEKKH